MGELNLERGERRVYQCHAERWLKQSRGQNWRTGTIRWCLVLGELTEERRGLPGGVGISCRKWFVLLEEEG